MRNFPSLLSKSASPSHRTGPPALTQNPPFPQHVSPPGLQHGPHFHYGAKIRAPHALVMTFLFRNGSLQEKLWAILQATYIHSWNLARFVFTYKGLRALQSYIQGKTYPAHAFLAAFLGGILVFGENNNINSQINMYLLSRVLFALSRLAVEKGYIPEPRWDPFPLLTAVVWGLVLWLFEYHRSTLQPSLQSSMTYLYEDSNVWHDISDFLIYNKSRPSN
ncbi:peroxisomal membrane protein 4 isoform X1 [Gorilla gorilla gorilla]|uniref:peroxisomal membrane protein 4 isoform X1 n=1 Tax=Gorilla gorilla gorilla TaxID=9595 RepID=UPI0008F4DE8E|nr:peroxisomal membrane protein 4 isoform X1 [Gorilla gorilla gorilla]